MWIDYRILNSIKVGFMNYINEKMSTIGPTAPLHDFRDFLGSYIKNLSDESE